MRRQLRFVAEERSLLRDVFENFSSNKKLLVIRASLLVTKGITRSK